MFQSFGNNSYILIYYFIHKNALTFNVSVIGDDAVIMYDVNAGCKFLNYFPLPKKL